MRGRNSIQSKYKMPSSLKPGGSFQVKWGSRFFGKFLISLPLKRWMLGKQRLDHCRSLLRDSLRGLKFSPFKNCYLAHHWLRYMMLRFYNNISFKRTKCTWTLKSTIDASWIPKIRCFRDQYYFFSLSEVSKMLIRNMGLSESWDVGPFEAAFGARSQGHYNEQLFDELWNKIFPPPTLSYSYAYHLCQTDNAFYTVINISDYHFQLKRIHLHKSFKFGLVRLELNFQHVLIHRKKIELFQEMWTKIKNEFQLWTNKHVNTVRQELANLQVEPFFLIF